MGAGEIDMLEVEMHATGNSAARKGFVGGDAGAAVEEDYS